MFARIRLISILVLFSTLVWPQLSSAQWMATVQARATVLPSMTIVGTHDLDFGPVLPGIEKAVEKTTVGHAGEWSIVGIPAAEVTLNFSLPDSLRAIETPDALPVKFSSADASYDDGTSRGQEVPAGIMNPHYVNTKKLGTDGVMTVWLGGAVAPSNSQTGGIYVGGITLTVTYVGN